MVFGYEILPSKNKVHCRGKLISGPDRGLVRFSAFLLVLFALLFWGGVIPYTILHINPIIFIFSVYGVAGNLITLFLAGFTDPGIIPRAKREPPELRKIKEKASSIDEDLSLKPEDYTQKTIIGNDNIIIELKYCETCKIHRPPRSSHCSKCDNCVEHFDHHCPWIGNCVGKGNYKYFYFFVGFSALNLLYSFLVCCGVVFAIVWRNRTDRAENIVLEVLKQAPLSPLLGIFFFLLMFSIGGLWVYHTYLLFVNRTTHEDMKSWLLQKNSKNNKRKGCSNYFYVLCGPPSFSYLLYRNELEEQDGKNFAYLLV